jgi:hypothetical protein
MHNTTPVNRRSAGPVLALALLLSACAVPMPQTEAQALREWGAPTARYPLQAGAQRLEYATGPEGLSTHMVDVDKSGQVVAARQVLTRPNLTLLQAAFPMPSQDLLLQVGRPGHVRGGGRQGGQVWTWRYAGADCLVFSVSVTDAGVATDGSFVPDPRCERFMPLLQAPIRHRAG